MAQGPSQPIVDAMLAIATATGTIAGAQTAIEVEQRLGHVDHQAHAGAAVAPGVTAAVGGSATLAAQFAALVAGLDARYAPHA
jgi:hypothetical protein